MEFNFFSQFYYFFSLELSCDSDTALDNWHLFDPKSINVFLISP